MGLDALYAVALISFTGAVHHVEFRKEILTTNDLSHPDLFNNALGIEAAGETGCLTSCGHTKTLAKDYWSSEVSMRRVDHELELASGWNFFPRLTSLRCSADPFQHEHIPHD
ncbi:hypothetical protein RND71_003293 [Anisodus tanguticus]|uniref:Uncharacterized protein n=1 Tax=Anisodus tanguticus TaxID=243964 RepID=A0AAE1SXM0_9SOLA|nr:hypothetical protein RND71_003293 [Anisodus tanguticus]